MGLSDFAPFTAGCEFIVRKPARLNEASDALMTAVSSCAGLSHQGRIGILPSTYSANTSYTSGGSVGASPVQNIGAYGVELQDRFDSLDALDLVTGQVFTLNAAQCAFGYRDSRFKRERDQWVITAVEFRLDKTRPLKMAYAGVPEELGGAGEILRHALPDLISRAFLNQTE